MEKSMQPQVQSEQDKMVPIDTSGDAVEIELKEEEIKQEDKKDGEVEVVQESPEETKKEDTSQKQETKDEELEEYSASVKRRIDKLTRKMREAERREQAAIEYAKKVQEEIKTIKTDKKESDVNYVSTLSTHLESRLKSAQDNLKNAISGGDVDKQVQYQREIAELTGQEDRVKREKTRLEKQVEQKETSASIPPETPASDVKPPPSPKAVAWADKNPWFGEDQVMTYAAYGIHQKLIGDEGFDSNSDDYYEEIDKRMKKEFPHKFKSDTNEVQVSNSKPVQTVASANRTTKTGRRTVKLTPSQVAIAKKLGVPLGEDQVMTYAAYGIHQKLIGDEGFDSNSDDYYEEIDKRMKKEFPHKFKSDTNEVQVSNSKPVQTVASANRTTKTGRRTVKLTPSQVAIAKKLGVPLEEYAKHVKEGA